MYEATDEGVVYIDDGTAWVPLRAVQEPAPSHIVWDQFVPGTLSARNPISVIANPVGAQVVLRYLEANLGQAPSTVDAANNLVLDVFGSISGLAELPLDVNGQSRFVRDEASPALSATEEQGSTAGYTSGKSALAFAIIPTSAVTLSALTLRMSGPSNRDWSVSGRARTLSADRQVELAASPFTTMVGPQSGQAWERVDLTDPVELVAGTTYWVAWELEGPEAQSGIWDFRCWDHPSTAAHGMNHPADGTLRTIAVVAGSGATVSDPVDGTNVLDSEVAYTAGNRGWATQFYGVPAGIPLDGSINLALSAVGAPGSNPGADLNITLRAELPA